MEALYKIAGYFVPGVPLQSITPLGNGLINDTYRVDTGQSSFVLQRINHQVFPEPPLIMENLATLDRHLRQSPAAVKLNIPALLNAGGQPWVFDPDSGYWRAQAFVADTMSLESVETPEYARQAGFALGHFHRLCHDLEPALLHDTLPGFHITPDYLQHYRNVCVDGGRKTPPENPYCREFIEQLSPSADSLEHAKRRGLLKLRVIHGDPKLNNFLFDRETGRVVSLIDLDTVKPGLVHYDIGDCLRSCCQIPPADGGTECFDLAIAEVLLAAYLEETRSFFSTQDYAYLYTAIELIPFELGLRFYTDYLQGNVYFKVSQPEQNLQRAVKQFELCASIRRQQCALKAVIAKLQYDYSPR